MNPNEFRQKIAEEFANLLESDGDLKWLKKWRSSTAPYNGASKHQYKGINYLILMLYAEKMGFKQPVWYTYNQIADCKGFYHKGQKWHLKAGSKGVHVEYWFPFDTKNKKVLKWPEYNKLIKDGRSEEEFAIRCKYDVVFNADCIEGLPPIEKKEVNFKPSDVVFKISKGMNVEILNDGNNSAFYNVEEDKIHLPKVEDFFNEEAYNLTALHELAHSTGHHTRLNRQIKNSFGSEDYAIEELIAEMASVFTSGCISTNNDYVDLNNHKAYVKSWIDCIKEKPDILSKAIKMAQDAADYMISFVN